MIKVYLDNGEIINCQEDFSEIVSMIVQAKNAKNIFFGLRNTDGDGVIIPSTKILRIEGPLKEVADSEVETGPYSEDIIVD